MANTDRNRQKHSMRIRRLGIDTYREPVIYMHQDCHICRSEGFEARSRIQVMVNDQSIVATLNIIRDSLLHPGELGLSDAAWHLLGRPGDDGTAFLSHPEPLTSLSYVRAKIYGHALSEDQLNHIMRDIVDGRYDDVHLSAFITACAGNRLNFDEVVFLTRSMINTGSRLDWEQPIRVDKHCVGGLPGNRTTLILVPIVAACGLTIPKTSSRSITSPAGTADTMETLAPVNLSLEQMRRVVQREGGCIAWGGAMHLSPADDILIAVERELDIDSEGQLIASVLSKKAAAGATHVLIDIPVGATAKVRSMNSARGLADTLIAVGNEISLNVRSRITDGSQPVGRGIGPALEARDVLAVLQRRDDAPQDLRERSLELAGDVLELAGKAGENKGYHLARSILDDGRAWSKFQAICEAQGGMREPGVATHRHEVTAEQDGCVTAIDNRRLALAAKLAGAPVDATAGIDLLVKQGQRVAKGETLFTVHAESPGELDYVLDYLAAQKDIITLSLDGEAREQRSA
ncbi:MAG: thymidine phosphorylase family protein [Gammaproteobacteria bacterium]